MDATHESLSVKQTTEPTEDPLTMWPFSKPKTQPEPKPLPPIARFRFTGDAARKAFSLLDAAKRGDSYEAMFDFWDYVQEKTGYGHDYHMSFIPGGGGDHLIVTVLYRKQLDADMRDIAR